MSQTKAQLLSPVGLVTFTGIDAASVTATSGSFTGAVSIGGTLTYEDVTNIDSVGLITARNGIKVSGGDIKVGTATTIENAGINVTGVVTATTFKGDGSQLTGIDATAIQTGNTSVQTVDTGSDGHIKMTTDGGERVRVGPAGQIGIGGTNYGSSGQLLVSGGSGAAPAWTTVSTAPEITATASGAIAANKAVIVNSDATVSTITGVDEAFGAWQQATTNNSSTAFYNFQVAEDGNGRVLYVYRNTTANPSVTDYVVGTKTGTTITWGTPARLSDSNIDGSDVQICSIGTDKFFAVYLDGESSYYMRVVSTTSSNTATLGTKLVLVDTSNNNINNNNGKNFQLHYNSTTGAILLGYILDSGGGAGLQGRMCTVSGTTITRGAAVQVNSNTPSNIASCYISSQKALLFVFKRANNSPPWFSAFIKEPASGTTVLIGAVDEVPNGSWTGNYHTCAYDPVKDMVIAAAMNTDDKIYYQLGTWTTANNANGGMDWANSAIFAINGVERTDMNYGQIVYQPTPQNMTWIYQEQATDNGYMIQFTLPDVKTGTITVDNSSYFEWETVQYQRTGSDARAGAGGQILIPFRDSNNKYGLKIKQFADTDVTAENYIGFSKEAYSDGETATINVVGNTTTQSSLTPGQKYYIDNAGDVSLTAATPSVVAGRALSATKLLIQPA